MSLVIISSTEDRASTNIKKGLLELSDWKEIDTFLTEPVFKKNNAEVYIVTINDRTILHEDLDKEIQHDLGINPTKALFISRHRSKSGEPTLTTHPIGNYHDALFGGKDRTLSPALPRMMSELLRIMNEIAQREKLYHQVSYEVTHHGPSMSIPTLFAEVGSTAEEWEKSHPAQVVAESILTLLSSYEDDFVDDVPVLVGIGGGHYAPRFTKVALQRKVAFGHMIPSYHIKPGHIDKEMLEKAIQASPGTSGIYLSRKALKKSTKTRIKSWCEDLNIPIVSSKDFTAL